MLYKNRREAGALVAEKLQHYKGNKDVLVIALPRGGVVNGQEIAKALGCPLDIIIVRKIGFPGQPELAIGAASETGAVVLNKEIISMGRVSDDYIKGETSRQRNEIERRKELYRAGRSIPSLKGKTVILVDDGVATGATMKAAISAIRQEGPQKIVVALPVSSMEAEKEISFMVDEWVCLQSPPDFLAIGAFYEDFSQVSDDEVIEMLRAGPDER